MKKIKARYILLCLFALLVIYITYYNSSKTFYVFNYDSILINHKYQLFDSSNSRILYFIKPNKCIMTFEKESFNDNENINLTMDRNERFILSMYASEDAVVRWTITDTLNKSSVVKLEESYYINPVNFNIHLFNGVKGGDIRRQNFEFKALKEGTERIELTDGHVNVVVNLKVK